MTEANLRGRTILVVEDEYLIADDVCDVLSDFGALVLGPAPNVEAATRLVANEPVIDGALLDINLAGTMVFGVADALVARGVPFAFATGYDRFSIPARFADVPRLEKPLRAAQVATAFETLTSADNV
jgi:CheY-like chemotaxis protein